MECTPCPFPNKKQAYLFQSPYFNKGYHRGLEKCAVQLDKMFVNQNLTSGARNREWSGNPRPPVSYLIIHTDVRKFTCLLHRLYLYTCTFVVRTWLLVCIRYKYKSWNYKHHQSQFHSPPWIKAMEALFYLSKVRMLGWVVSRGGGGLLGRIVLLLTWQFPEGASLGQEREQIQRVCWYSFIVFDILLHVWYLYSVL